MIRILTLVCLCLLCTPAAALCQDSQEPRQDPPSGINISKKPVLQGGMKKLFCVALECENWELMFKWIAGVDKAMKGRFGKRRLGAPGPGAITLSDTSNEHTGNDPTVEEWTADPDNVVMFNQDYIGGNRFMNPDQNASDCLMAGAVAHEMTHCDDEYTWKNGKPATPGDAKKLACEEVKGYECELKVLEAFKAGKCLTAIELAAILKALCDRIDDVKALRDAEKQRVWRCTTDPSASRGRPCT
ncbi:MAG: hypothetical protein H6832_17970 [Planctomycetes bacterium]|nr:hypothetical protein [Planctomycetota bacterium]MCB9920293.1 hypothetical protein [Planctomycetota bacterium]